MFSTSSSLLFKHSVNGIIKRLQTNKFRIQQFDKRLNYKYFSKSSAKSKVTNGKNRLMPAQNNNNKKGRISNSMNLNQVKIIINKK